MPKYYHSEPPISQIYLDNVLLRLPGSIYWKDKDGVYLGCNSFQAQIVGFDSPADVIGKTDYDFPWRDLAGTLKETDQRIMRTGKSEELYENLVLPDSTPLIVLTNKSPLYDEEGKIIGIIGTSLDVTTLKKIEAQKNLALQQAAIAEEKARLEEQNSEALVVLAGSIAHDLRFPLVKIEMLDNLLSETMPLILQYYEAAKNYGVHIPSPIKPVRLNLLKDLNNREGINLKEIHNSIQNYIDDNLKSIRSNIQKKPLQEDLIECNSHYVLKNALDSYPFAEGEKDLVHLNDTFQFKFLGNPDLFKRVIFNLFDNALYQIRQNGKGEIYITTEDQSDEEDHDDDKHNVIKFMDTAGGIPDEQIDKIFKPYRSTKPEGTGIGLAYCKYAMRRMNAGIACLSYEDTDEMIFELIFDKPKNS